MSRWFKQIIYFLCILEISSANPTRATDIIKDQEEVKFQNKLPEETLDSEDTVVGNPLNKTTHRLGQLGNNQSLFRENGKNHCPFCQYAPSTQGAIENQDQDSESTQPYLIIGNIKPVQTNIVAEEDAPPIDNNSTWNPQNEIRAILKIPDVSSSNNGKEYKRCTHNDNNLGGRLQNTEIDNNLLNNPDALNNIDFSCCSTLRRIILNALKLDGKCSCSELRANSPIINITAVKDNAFESAIIRQEFPPIFIRQQQNMPSKILNQEQKARNTLLGEGDTKAIKHNEENHVLNTPGIQDKEDNITNLDSGMQEWAKHSDGSNVTSNNMVNTSLITDGKMKEFIKNNGSNIDVKPIINAADKLGTLSRNDGLITEKRTENGPTVEVKNDSVINDMTKVSSSMNMSGENIDVSSTESNEALEQKDEYYNKTFTKVNYSSTDNNSKGILGLFVGQGINNNSLKDELNRNHKNEEKIYNFNGVTNNYTTESVLFVMESKDLNSTKSSDDLSEMNIQFSDGITESNQESTQNMQALKPRSTDNDFDITFEEKANYTDGNLLETPMIDHELLQSKAENQSLGYEKVSRGSGEIFLKDAANQSTTAMIENRNKFPTTNTEDWPEVNSLSTTAYELGQNLEIDNTSSEKGDPKHSMNTFIDSTTGPSIIFTIEPEISIEPSKEYDLKQLKYQSRDFQEVFNYSDSFNDGSEPPKMQDVSGNLLEEFHETETTEQQNQFEDTQVDDQIPNLDGGISVEISTEPPEYSTHLLSLPRQHLLNDKSIAQLNSSTQTVLNNEVTESSTDITSRDSTPSFKLNSLTMESTLQDTRNSTSSFKVNSLTTESILQETKSTEALMGNEMPILSKENTSSINSSDFLTNHQQFSSQDYLLGTELPQSTDSLLVDGVSNLTTGKSSDIKLSDPKENNQQSLLRETEQTDHQSQNGEDIPPDGLEPGNYLSNQTQPTGSPLEGGILNLTTGSSSNIKLDNPMENNQPGETEKIVNPSEIGQDIVSGAVGPDNYIFGSNQTSGVESGTLSTELISTFTSNYLDMNVGTVATTPLEASLLSQFVEDITIKNQLSTETITSELLLATDKIGVNEVPHEENSTVIDLEMAKAEDTLKHLIEGFKKTHFHETSDSAITTDNPELALLETSTYVTLLENINELKPSDKPKYGDEDPINIETYTDKSKYIDEYPNRFTVDVNSNDMNVILQNQQISSTITNEDILESTTMTSDSIKATTTSSDNLIGIQHSSEINKASSSRINLVDYDKYLAEINELHKFSNDSQSISIQNLVESDSSSTIPPDYKYQIINTKNSTEEPSLSMINLITPRPTNDVKLTIVSHNTELVTSTESELERASEKDVTQNLQEISNPNFVSLIPKEFETATLNAINREDKTNFSNDFSGKKTKISVGNNVTPENSDISLNLGQSLPSKVESPVNELNSTDLEEEILSTGNYQVHHVNISKYEGFEDQNAQETSTSNFNSNNMILEEFETTTKITKHQEDNNTDLGFSYLTSNLSKESKLIESTTIKLIKSDNENTDLAQISTPTEILSEFEIHSPVIVCLPEQDSLHLNNDLLGSRFFIQNEANVIEFDLVQRNESLCGCPHNSYELKPKSRVSKADIHLLKSLQGQHISKILRRAHKTNDNYEMTTRNDNLLKIHLDSDKKKMSMTLDKAEEINEDSENQALGNEDYRESDNLKEKHSCNCQCLGNVDSSRAFLENRGEPHNVRGADIDRGQDRSLKSQIKISKSENVMRLDNDRSDYKEEGNYKSKHNRGSQQSRRRDFPIMVDKDILKRFISVYRPHKYLRRS